MQLDKQMAIKQLESKLPVMSNNHNKYSICSIHSFLIHLSIITLDNLLYILNTTDKLTIYNTPNRY